MSSSVLALCLWMGTLFVQNINIDRSPICADAVCQLNDSTARGIGADSNNDD